MDHGAWIMDHGAWIMDHGAWSMDHGSWSMDHGSWSNVQCAMCNVQCAMEHPYSLGAWQAAFDSIRFDNGLLILAGDDVSFFFLTATTSPSLQPPLYNTLKKEHVSADTALLDQPNPYLPGKHAL